MEGINMHSKYNSLKLHRAIATERKKKTKKLHPNLHTGRTHLYNLRSCSHVI